MTRKILSLVLALAMILSMSAVYASAEGTEPKAGYYVLYSMTEGDTVVGNDTVTSLGISETVTLTLNEDGTAHFVYDEDSVDLTWGNGVLTDGSEDVPYTVDGDQITLAEGDTTIVFVYSSDKAPESSAEESKEESSEESKDGEKTEGGLPVNDPAVHNAVALTEEVTLIDQDGISLTLTGIELDDSSSWGSYTISYTIKNGSDKNIYVQSDNLSVNGIMANFGSIWENVDAGKNAKGTMTFYLDNLEDIGVGTITDLNLRLKVEDGDSNDDLFTTDYIDVQTDAYGTMETVPDSEGSELYNANNVILNVKNLIPDEDEYYIGIVNFYVQNDNDYTLYLSSSDNYINGWDSDSGLYVTVAPHKCALVQMNIYDDAEDLDIKDYTEITEMEFDLAVYQYDEWEKVDEAPISITFTDAE